MGAAKGYVPGGGATMTPVSPPNENCPGASGAAGGAGGGGYDSGGGWDDALATDPTTVVAGGGSRDDALATDPATVATDPPTVCTVSSCILRSFIF